MAQQYKLSVKGCNLINVVTRVACQSKSKQVIKKKKKKLFSNVIQRSTAGEEWGESLMNHQNQ